jgi:5-methylcytosine-specific restriction endonuclease McrA
MPSINRKGRKKPWLTYKKGRAKFSPDGTKKEAFAGYGADADKRYKTAEWKATRRAVLAKQPTCIWCLPCGRLSEATAVDHLIPAHRLPEGTSFYDQSNLVGSCKSCNSRRASYEAKGVSFDTIEEWQAFLAEREKNKRL